MDPTSSDSNSTQPIGFDAFLRRLAQIPKTNPSGFLTLHPGETVDHYQVLRLLGRGGMATVYLARDLKLGRMAALKLLTAPSLPSRQKRFLLEGQLTALFNHPNIVTIYGVGEYRNHAYLALEYIQGETLRDRLDIHHLGATPAARIGVAIANALCAAHEQDLIHQDLKPSNVMITRTGQIRVLDFGIARLNASREDVGPSASTTIKRSSQQSAGTPAYMAPEQWQGASTSPATDVWALGLILYEMISGEHPFVSRASDTQELRKLVCHEKAPHLAGIAQVTEPIDTLVESCLARDPSARPSARDVLATLESFLGDRYQVDPEGCPFRGLLSFEEEHAHLFFGRELEIQAFVERLRTTPILPIVGPSGAGKSSFVKAGVLPRLRERGRIILLHMRPGRDPFRALGHVLRKHETQQTAKLVPAHDIKETAEHLRHDPRFLGRWLYRLAEEQQAPVVLFVDQLEELCAIDDGPTEDLRPFVEALALSADVPDLPVRVIATVREEFLSRLAVSPTASVTFENLEVLRQPSSETLRGIMRSLVEQAGYRYEDARTLDDMITEVHGQRAPLPLLQFAGTRLWEGRNVDDKTLPDAVYRSMGGVAGALVQHADAVFAGFDTSEGDLCRRVFLRLVTADRTRKSASQGEFLELAEGRIASMEKVLSRLVDMRLLVSEGREESSNTVELVHEALIEQWPRLTTWLDESRDETQFLARLAPTAREWDRSGRQPGYLWQGDAALDAKRFVRQAIQGAGSQVSRTERAYLDAVVELSERVRRRRTRTTVGAFVTLVATALVFLSLAVQARRGESLARDVVRLAYAEKYSTNPTIALSLLREVSSDKPPPSWGRLAQRALGAALVRRQLRQASAVTALATSAESTRLASGGSDGTVSVWTLEPPPHPIIAQSLIGHQGRVLAVSFSPDGRHLVSGGQDATLRLWKVDNGRFELVRALTGHRGPVEDLVFSPDGQAFASSSKDGTLRLWPVPIRDNAQTMVLKSGTVKNLTFSPDGRLLAGSGPGEQIHVWRVPTPSSNNVAGTHRVLTGHTSGILALSFAGQNALISSSNREVKQWNLEVPTARSKTQRAWATFEPQHIVFSGEGIYPHSLRIAAVASDATLHVYEGKPGESSTRIALPSATVGAVAFLPGRSRVVVGLADGSLQFADTTSGHDAQVLCGHEGPVYGLDISPDGNAALSTGEDGELLLWSLLEPQRPPRWLGRLGTPAYDIAFSTDGNSAALASDDGAVRIWALHSPTDMPTVLRGHTSWVEAVAYAPGGGLLASASEDGTVRLWNIETFVTTRVLRGHAGAVRDVAFSPDGAHLASVGADKTLRIWPIEAGTQEHGPSAAPRVIKHTHGLWTVGFSKRGPHVIAAGEGGKVLQWSLRDLEREPRVLMTHEGRVYDVSYAPDGSVLASVSTDQTLKILDLRTPLSRQQQTDPWVLRGHTRGALAVAIVPAGSDHRSLRALTGSADGTLRLWDRLGAPKVDDDALWSATGLCLAPSFREAELGESASEAERWYRTCKKQVSQSRPRARARRCLSRPRTRSVARHGPTPSPESAPLVATTTSPLAMPWLKMPAGWFEMGSGRGGLSETPHWIRLSSFEIAKTETTVAQYLACVEAKACEPLVELGQCNTVHADTRRNHPVQCASWNDAQTFCNWAGGRLPTEAEWEYAARSWGQDTTFPWGDDPPDCSRVVFTQEDADVPSCGRGTGTWPVCSRPRGNTQQGACDMAGNVTEWTHDLYRRSSYLDGPVRDPQGPVDGEHRVVRGGGWNYNAMFLRTTYRDWSAAGFRGLNSGFRCAR